MRRRLAPIEVELRALELEPPDRGVLLLEPPPVDHAGVTLAPDVPVRRLGLDDPPVDVEDIGLAPLVDVLPVRLADTLFAERDRDVRLPGARIHAMPLVSATLQSMVIVRGAHVRREHPDRVARMFRRATPLERLPPEHVKECVRRLYRQSGLASPAQLGLVGIFERVPGGAVRAVSQHPNGVILRLDPQARALPATLVVGKRRRDGHLITAEVPPRVG